jgi:hypothetical protein
MDLFDRFSSPAVPGERPALYQRSLEAALIRPMQELSKTFLKHWSEDTQEEIGRTYEIMKAIVIHGYGGPEVLRYEDYPDPVPGIGEVLVQVAASSVNPFDFKIRSGSLKGFGRKIRCDRARNRCRRQRGPIGGL